MDYNSLKRILKEERRKREKLSQKQKIQPDYKADKQNFHQSLIISGSEVANTRNPGFPTFAEIIQICEIALEQEFYPITVVIDDSLRYLLDVEDSSLLEKIINDGQFTVANRVIKLIEILGYEAMLTKMLTLGYETNSQILINDSKNEIIEVYGDKFPWLIKLSWQIKYELLKTRIKLIRK